MRWFSASVLAASVAVWGMGCEEQPPNRPGDAPPGAGGAPPQQRQPGPGPDATQPPQQPGQPAPMNQPGQSNFQQPTEQPRPAFPPGPADQSGEAPVERSEGDLVEENRGTFEQDGFVPPDPE